MLRSTNFILTFLLLLLSIALVVKGRIGEKKKELPMSQAVDFQTFDLDGQVHDLLWCGNHNDIVLMHTSEGFIYRSRDRGGSWKHLHGMLHRQAYDVAD